MVWAVVPDTTDKGIRFIRASGDLNYGIVGMNEGIDNEVKGDYDKVRIEYPPLKVMFTSNLEVRRLLVIDGNNRLIVTSVHQLSVWGYQRFS